jgi:hypothetical protein
MPKPPTFSGSSFMVGGGGLFPSALGRAQSALSKNLDNHGYTGITGGRDIR